MTDELVKYVAARLEVHVTVESFAPTDGSMFAKRSVTLQVDETFANDAELEGAVERLAQNILTAARR